MLTRRTLGLGLISLIVAALFATQSWGHHGWRWTDSGNFELTGVIVAARLGNPHGLLTVKAEDEEWVVEVGQPWRNERAGLADSMLVEGVEIIVIGQRSADHNEKRMKAERVRIDGKDYVLYQERD